MHYYAIINDHRIGPLDLSTLVTTPGFDRDTLIWCEGMETWSPCWADPKALECYEALCGSRSHRTIPPPMDPEEPYNAPRYSYSDPYTPVERPYNWLGWSIFNTVMGACGGVILLVLGIIGIVYSVQAGNRYDSGDYAGAYRSAKTARTVNVICFCLLGIGLALILLFFVGCVSLGLLHFPHYIFQ